jgi:hypothetical protein
MGTKRVGFARIRSLINENTNQLQQRLRGTKAIAGGTTLTADDSGKVILMSTKTSADYDVTLPACAAGLSFTFILATTGNDSSADINVKVAASADDFVGNLWGLSAVDPATDSDEKIRFDQSGGAKVGDYVEIYSDGTDWFVRGQGSANNAIVFA